VNQANTKDIFDELGDVQKPASKNLKKKQPVIPGMRFGKRAN